MENKVEYEWLAEANTYWRSNEVRSYIENSEALYHKVIGIAKLIAKSPDKEVVIHGPFDMGFFNNWCMHQADYGSDYFSSRRSEWEWQETWDQSVNWEQGQRVRKIINMKMPKDEIWIGEGEDKVIIKVIGEP